ncbi:uncharacterized protein H6S33_010802 [Morchella sextelata]|uniref:uncharacterized protein n=1 Tax=Morchella sextelata TaxID=1174677 RepID=UPI001D051FBB|nr:uncharacterized protein H6S33_010802 [Morchella sextelata]KAH0611537.1 hypothetical protein H6S33_010802 [Morchella sextelata]
MSDTTQDTLLQRLSEFLTTYGPLPADIDFGEELTEAHSLIAKCLEALTKPLDIPAPLEPVIDTAQEEVIAGLTTELEAANEKAADFWQTLCDNQEDSTEIIRGRDEVIVALKIELEESKAEEEELRLAIADEKLADVDDEILHITSIAKAWEAQANATIADLRSRIPVSIATVKSRHVSKPRYLAPRAQNPRSISNWRERPLENGSSKPALKAPPPVPVLPAAAAVSEDKMSEDSLVVTCSVSQNPDSFIPTYALIDTGASGYAFIDESFVRHNNLAMTPLRKSRQVDVMDGRPIQSGEITHIVDVSLDIHGHREIASCFVTKLGHYPIVMGIPWMRRHDVTIRPKDNLLIFDSRNCCQHCSLSGTTVTVHGISIPPPEHHTVVVSAVEKSTVDVKPLVPKEFHHRLHMFQEYDASVLPPHRPSHDIEIVLEEGKRPPHGPIYGLSQVELKALREYLDENLPKGFIRASESPAGAPILFVKKSDGTLRLCVDYRGLNAITVKNRYPLPLLKETLAKLSKAQYYTKLDLRWGYNQIRIAEGDEWKTAFRTRYGHFEYTVMPFGLANAPATFQHWINDILRPYLDQFVTAYLDDILIYSETLAEHKEHIRKVLKVLDESHVHLKPEKCEFIVQETKYLGLILTPDGNRMDPKKVVDVLEWSTPRNLHDIQVFLGFANFYRRFILGYLKIVAPLTALTKKNVKFEWTDEREEAFQTLKRMFTTAPILMHFDPDRKIVVETDASDYVSAGILSQCDDEGILHPVAFFSKKHSPAECNYEIYDKELLAIVRCFEEWRHYLEGAQFPIEVLSDHRNLEYFMSTKLLNRRQARWSEFLSRFDFVIQFRPGKQGAKPDALTRRSGDLPKEGDERLTHQSQVVLKRKNLDSKLSLFAGSFSNESAEGMSTVEELFSNAYQVDSFPNKVLAMLRNGVRHSSKISLAECTEDNNGRLLYRGALYVPDDNDLRLKLLKEYHDNPSAGHPGRAKTLELLNREYYWPRMRNYVDQYVRNCNVCARSKASRNAPYGVLRPMPIPDGPWMDVSMDFVTDLPESDGYNAILVVVDRLTKMRHFIPTTKEADSKEVARLYIDNVWKLHGLPETMVSDRGTQFVAEFWRSLCDRLEISPKFSTAFHPQTDGQTERINAVMEQYLRSYVSYQQDDWVRWLPMAEFATNNHASETTRISPFYANSGRNPRMTFGPLEHGRTTAEDQANSIAREMKDILDFLKDELFRAQRIQEESANIRRTPAPHYRVGDRVFLSTRHVLTKRPSKKLDWKRIGPYIVKRIVSPYAYELELPRSMKVHPVFHVSLLSSAANDPLPGQQQLPPPPVEVEGQEEWEVEDILDSRDRRGRFEYLVKYVGYDEASWQPLSDVEHSPDIVKRFHKRYPRKPKPTRR